MTEKKPELTSRRLDRQMLTDQVHDVLLEDLMSGRFPAGTAINIERTARDLAISATPVREALARLEATGLVDRTPLVGYRVTPPLAPAAFADLMDARQVIEGANAERAAKNIDRAGLSDLLGLIEDLRSAPHGPSFPQYRAYWQADEKFHQLISESADNRFLQAAYTSLGGQVQRFRLFGGLGVTDAEFAITEHAAVLEALRSGDGVASREAMVAHITAVQKRATHDLDHGTHVSEPESATASVRPQRRTSGRTPKP